MSVPLLSRSTFSIFLPARFPDEPSVEETLLSEFGELCDLQACVNDSDIVGSIPAATINVFLVSLG